MENELLFHQTSPPKIRIIENGPIRMEWNEPVEEIGSNCIIFDAQKEYQEKLPQTNFTTEWA